VTPENKKHEIALKFKVLEGPGLSDYDREPFDPDLRALLPILSQNDKRRLLKPAPRAGFQFGMPIEMIVQVFHRILDLKYGLGFYPGLFKEAERKC
jgi:hypothetical protein